MRSLREIEIEEIRKVIVRLVCDNSPWLFDQLAEAVHNAEIIHGELCHEADLLTQEPN